MEFKSVKKCRGEITVPGDKSISHRAVMFGSLAKGTTQVTGFLKGADCLSTISCFRQLGVSIEEKDQKIIWKNSVARRNEFMDKFIANIFNEDEELYEHLFANKVEDETDD